ncbi:hypothetical protein Dimus_033199 [Dionaea muscipula]
MLFILTKLADHVDQHSAEVVYAKRSDAFAALRRYNNVQLDGRPMKIEMLNHNSEVPASRHVNVIGGMNGWTARKVVLNPRIRGGSQNGQGPQGRLALQGSTGLKSNGQGQGRNRGQGGGRGRGQGKKKRTEKSAAELDKELDKYHAEAMQI